MEAWMTSGSRLFALFQTYVHSPVIRYRRETASKRPAQRGAVITLACHISLSGYHYDSRCLIMQHIYFSTLDVCYRCDRYGSGSNLNFCLIIWNCCSRCLRRRRNQKKMTMPMDPNPKTPPTVLPTMVFVLSLDLLLKSGLLPVPLVVLLERVQQGI